MLPPANDNPVIAPKTRIGRIFEAYLDFAPQAGLFLATAMAVFKVAYLDLVEWVLLACLGVIISLWVATCVWQIRGDREFRRAFTWPVYVMLALAAMQVSSAMTKARYLDHQAFQNAVAFETGKNVISNLKDGMLAAEIVSNGHHSGRTWELSAHDGGEGRLIQISFQDHYACSFLMEQVRPFTGTLEAVQLGEVTLEHWPRDEELREHCGTNVRLIYAGQGEEP